MTFIYSQIGKSRLTPINWRTPTTKLGRIATFSLIHSHWTYQCRVKEGWIIPPPALPLPCTPLPMFDKVCNVVVGIRGVRHVI